MSLNLEGGWDGHRMSYVVAEIIGCKEPLGCVSMVTSRAAQQLWWE